MGGAGSVFHRINVRNRMKSVMRSGKLRYEEASERRGEEDGRRVRVTFRGDDKKKKK